jgi:phage protein D
MYFNGTAATQDQLARVEEISVEQDADAAWEARIQLIVALDEHGNWQNTDDTFTTDFSRVRVELQFNTDPWVPLIDGPVVGVDHSLHNEPGKSTITLIVQDDSVLLNRTAQTQVFEGQSDSDIATQLFNAVPGITPGNIQSTTPSADPLGGVTVQRETSIQLLRRLARRNGYHAYVLPGDSPGQSQGCFAPYATDPTTGLPTLVLLGADRNMENFSATNDAQSPTRYSASTVGIGDRSTSDQTSSFGNVPQLGDQPAYSDESSTGQDYLSPHDLDEDPSRATSAATTRSAYSVHATGRTLPDCYNGILVPFDVVTVQAGPMQHSGNYVITKVHHRVTRSLHSQEFTLVSDSRATVSSGGGANPLSGVF